MSRISKKYQNPFFKAKEPLAATKANAFAILQVAIAYHQQGHLSKAEKMYQQILEINPRCADCLNLLGVIAYQTGKYQSAAYLIGQAIEINPNDASYYSNLGIALKELSKFDLALASYEKAIALKPDYSEAYSNLGLLLKELKNLDAAVASYDKAIVLKPDNAEAYSNRGIALQELKQFDAALASYDKAIGLKPEYAQAYSNRGIALHELKQFDAAVASYDMAIALKPDYAEAYSNRGSVLEEQKQLEAALANYQTAFNLNPDFEYLFGTIFDIKMQLCDWHNFNQNIFELNQKILAGLKVSPCFPTLGLPISLPAQRKSAEIWIADKYPSNLSLGPIAQSKRQLKIRIGYYSADFYNHATAYLMAELFERHDKSKFELIAFSFGPDRKDEMHNRVSQAFDRFLDVTTMSDKAVVKLSRELDIHIAVDLKGLTQNTRLGIFSYKAAPIQVSYLGFPGTLGADYIDYLIADKTVIPLDRQKHYSEKIVYLPNSYQVNDRQRAIAPKLFTKQELGLPQDSFVFCCFNNNFKITPNIFDVWMRILNAVEKSVLWLLEDNSPAVKNLSKEAQLRGVKSNRLVFAKRMALPEHLARQKVADLFLDTLPYNAHTTASDALWAGLPVLTCMGESFASRVAASLLNAVGLPELVTHTQADYESIAIDLATNPAKLKAIKDKLEHTRLTHPLFDTPRFIKHIEEAYTKIYERYQDDLPPDHIYINA